METIYPTKIVLSSSEYEILEDKQNKDANNVAKGGMDMYQQENSSGAFGISMGLPIMQIVLVALSLFIATTESDLALLMITIVGTFTVGLICDIVGTTIAVRAGKEEPHKNYQIPLYLNLFLLVPKSLLLVAIVASCL